MKNFREIIALFVIAGLTGAYVLWVWGVPWNLIWIIIPWLAIPGIVSITFTVGKKRTAWFKDAEAHENFKNDLWRRAVPDNGNPTYQTSADRAVAHADRLVDRQINKVRGILPFNSIIMTVLGLERYRLSPHLLSVNPWGEIIYWLPTSAFLIVLILLGCPACIVSSCFGSIGIRTLGTVIFVTSSIALSICSMRGASASLGR